MSEEKTEKVANHNLLEARQFYKPLGYPWAFEAFQLQHQMHWIPSEVPLHEDVRDWSNVLTPEEKNLITQIFRFFTQGDISVAEGYVNNYLPVFKPVEVQMMMLAFAAMEGVHVHAYSLLLDTIGMPETEYAAFVKYEAMAAKHDYLLNFNSRSKAGIAKSLAVYSAFTEGLQLFSSFAILLNFNRFGKMNGMGQIVTWSIRDETLHVESMIKLFRVFIQENPRVWTKKFQQELYDIAKTMVELEDAFIDLAFEMGGIEGLTSEEVKTYIRYIADRRLIQLGLKGMFNQRENPLDWMEFLLQAPEHTNFFENKPTAYSKGALRGDWSDIWGKYRK